MNDRADQSLGEFARPVLVFVLIVGLAMLAWRLADILLLAFIGALFAALLSTLATWIHRHTRIPTHLALVLVVIVLVLFAGLFILLAGATINAQLGQFISTLPNSVNQIRDLMGQNALGRYIPDHMGQAQLGADDWHFAAFTLAFCWDGGTIRPQ